MHPTTALSQLGRTYSRVVSVARRRERECTGSRSLDLALAGDVRGPAPSLCSAGWPSARRVRNTRECIHMRRDSLTF
mgnify:CR=1 FL=1